MSICIKQWPKAVALGLLLVIVFALFFVHVPALVASEQNGDPAFAIPLLLESNFSYEYLHSVLKTPVQENFTLAPGNDLLLTSTTYKSLGVGTPFLEGEGEFENHNGLFVLKGQNRHFQQLNFGVISFTNQAILYRGKRYYLKDYFVSGSLIQLQVKQWSLARILAIDFRKEVKFERT